MKAVTIQMQSITMENETGGDDKHNHEYIDERDALEADTHECHNYDCIGGGHTLTNDR